jgi:thioredoxin-related protein
MYNYTFYKKFIRNMLVLLIMTFAGQINAAGGKDPYVYFFNETWGDFSEEIKKAKDEGKSGVLLFFEMDECPFCHRMKETVLNQPEVQAYFRKHFLSFSVDIEGDVEITDFKGNTFSQKDFAFKINRVRATPVFAFYDLTGEKIVRYTGATSGIEEFMWLGEYVVNGIYKEMRFAKYKRQKKKAIKQSS